MHPEIDKFANLNSPIHAWDPRFKLFSLFVFIITTTAANSLPLVMACFTVAIILTLISRIPLHFVFARLRWVIGFLLPFFIILPLTTKGEAAFTIFTLNVTKPGLTLATLIYFRALTIVLIIFPAFGTAPFDVTMKSLQRLKVPGILVQLILLTYRYIFVFIEEIRLLETAIKARGFEKRSDWFTFKTMGYLMGTLLVNSFEKTERIYFAMLARGYNGTLVAYHHYQSTTSDWVKCFILLIISSLLFYGRTL